MIIVSLLIISSVNNLGLQAAHITISDLLVKNQIFFVLLLQTVTVAHAFINSDVIGFHTILLLHITVTFFQANFISRYFSISMIHSGVHGMKPELSQIAIFHIFSGEKPSISLFGFIDFNIFLVFICLGKGN
jgi:hypothetical protein